MMDLWQRLLDPDEQGRWGLLLTLIIAIGAACWALFVYFRPQTTTKKARTPSGGRGGDASVQGAGMAMGGRGGQAGDLADGGHGGHAHIVGSGTAIGGDGGDGAVSWRPALGGASATERLPPNGLTSFLPRDQFGLMIAGRGGAGGDPDVTVTVGARELPFLPMLTLLRLWAPDALKALDAMRPRSPQDGWELARERFPEVSSAVERHVKHCLDVSGPKGLPPPDPYLGPDCVAPHHEE